MSKTEEYLRVLDALAECRAENKRLTVALNYESGLAKLRGEENARLRADMVGDQQPTDLAELNARVESYFNTGKPAQPAGRLILDLMRALRKATQ